MKDAGQWLNSEAAKSRSREARPLCAARNQRILRPEHRGAGNQERYSRYDWQNEARDSCPEQGPSGDLPPTPGFGGIPDGKLLIGICPFTNVTETRVRESAPESFGLSVV
jgi:hypothetical protein